MTSEPMRGWHPLVMVCPDCDGPGDPECENCGGTGKMPGSHAINEGLFVDGRCIAKVESFYDEGSWYATAFTPHGDHVRGGAMTSHSVAAEWCERTSGFAVSRALAHPLPPPRTGGGRADGEGIGHEAAAVGGGA